MNTFVGSVRVREAAKVFTAKASGKPMAAIKCYASVSAGKGDDGKWQYRYMNFKVLASGEWLVKLCETLQPKVDIMVKGSINGVDAWVSKESGEAASEIVVMANDILLLAPREARESREGSEAPRQDRKAKAAAPKSQAKPVTEGDEDFPF